MPRPWISTNLAISADGKISDIHHRPANWTSKNDHQRLLELRKNADALMAGRGTVTADQMTMTVKGQEKQPLRCIISSKGELAADHPIFDTQGGDIHILATETPAAANHLKATVHQQSLAEFLETLSTQFDVKQIHCEGGGELIHALAKLDAIDEFHVTLCGHTLFGGEKAPTPTSIPAEFLPNGRAFEISHFEPHPELGECFLTYRRKTS